jgi:S-(hydroxymethyl)glutathione dehydrogenase/alcohol dehydrogenase
MLTLFEKTVKGSLFGSANPHRDIPKMLELYRAGRLQLDGLVTTRYRLGGINEGYRDLEEGRDIRGVIIH